MAGARQFGKPDQGIFAFWIHSWREGRPLKYIGFDGLGHQVRDCLHPRDLAPLILSQMNGSPATNSPIVNISGGIASAMSLRQLSDWCADRYPASATMASLPTEHSPNQAAAEKRPFDLPWVVLDPTLVGQVWHWQPQTPVHSILAEIAAFADANPGWIAVSA